MQMDMGRDYAVERSKSCSLVIQQRRTPLPMSDNSGDYRPKGVNPTSDEILRRMAQITGTGNLRERIYTAILILNLSGDYVY